MCESGEAATRPGGLDAGMPLDEGNDLLIEPPAMGWHTVTLHAADGGGLEASSSVWVWVGHGISLPMIAGR